jgi:hypothetical protein
MQSFAVDDKLTKIKKHGSFPVLPRHSGGKGGSRLVIQDCKLITPASIEILRCDEVRAKLERRICIWLSLAAALSIYHFQL